MESCVFTNNVKKRNNYFFKSQKTLIQCYPKCNTLPRKWWRHLSQSCTEEEDVLSSGKVIIRISDCRLPMRKLPLWMNIWPVDLAVTYQSLIMRIGLRVKFQNGALSMRTACMTWLVSEVLWVFSAVVTDCLPLMRALSYGYL